MTDRPHGTRRRYIYGPDANDQPDKGCHCPDCNEANNEFNRGTRRRMAERQWTDTPAFVAAEPVRQHIRALMAAGPGWMHLAEVAGVSRSVVCSLLYSVNGRPLTQRMRPDLAAKLLAVTVDQALQPGTHIDATGTRRRIQALTAIGWTLSEQGRRLGRAATNMGALLNARRVTVRVAQQVADLYDELSMTPAPDGTFSRQARARAAAKGWPPPLAWDDDTIDDPTAAPDLGAKTRREDALAEDSDELLRQGHTVDQAAERLGVSRTYLQNARDRARARERRTA